MPRGYTNNPKQSKTIHPVLSDNWDKVNRTYADLSTDSNTSLDILGLIKFQKDVDQK